MAQPAGRKSGQAPQASAASPAVLEIAGSASGDAAFTVDAMAISPTAAAGKRPHIAFWDCMVVTPLDRREAQRGRTGPWKLGDSMEIAWRRSVTGPVADLCCRP